jgi:hypothetical protein
MSDQRILLFAHSTPNPNRQETTDKTINPLSEKANEALTDLGAGWQVVSASTTAYHYLQGNLPMIEHILTVAVRKTE